MNPEKSEPTKPIDGPQKAQVLVISHDRVGTEMAGQGIRFWELARALSREFSVILAVPESTSLSGDGFELIAYEAHTWHGLEEPARRWATVVVTSPYLIHNIPWLRTLTIPIVADVYVPIAAESLAWHAFSEPGRQTEVYRYSWRVTKAIAQHADFLICPGERQRDFWLGALAAHGRLHPELYRTDPDLRNLIATVPFGCPSIAPQHAPALKGVVPGIGPSDRVILWGSGIWNWFDPITLLRALPAVLKDHPNTRLVFMGADHPDSERVPEMERARQARALSRDLNLEGTAVFWIPWVPYAERGAYLLDSDVGVSLHREGVETRLAFRTRLLDSIWASLPMVITRGDVLAEEFVQWGVGYAVDAGAEDQVAAALSTLLDEPDTRLPRAAAFDQLRQQYAWDQVTIPLKHFCHAPYKGPGQQEAVDLAQGHEDKKRTALETEITRLQELVRGYESGRMMRLLNTFHRLRSRLGNG